MKPYYRTENGVLYHGDCLEIMPHLEPVDLVLTDPPYGTSACKWDSVIPLKPMWNHLGRIIRAGGAIVMTASQPFTTTLISSNIKMFKYSWIWEKERGTNFLNFKYQPAKAHEDVVVFGKMATSYSKRGTMLYYPQMESGKPYQCKQGRAGDAVARDKKTRTNSVKTVNKG